jgi:hypothetical protein
MIHNKVLLRNSKPITQGAWTVTGIKNIILHVHGIGEVHLTTQIEGVEYLQLLQGVIYVPEIGITYFQLLQQLKLEWKYLLKIIK